MKKHFSICLIFITSISIAQELFLIKNDFDFQKGNAAKLIQYNSPYSDYGFRVNGDEMYIVREDKVNKNLASLFLLEGSEETRVFSKSSIHIADATFSKDKNTMYVTKTIDKKKWGSTVSDTPINLTIAKFNRQGKKWKIDSDFKYFDQKGYNFAHPTLYGNFLYFSSNIKGSIGGMDIFRIDLTKSESKPQNLGPKINTTENEIFPFVDEKGVLFFTSDGKSQNMGYDIFSIPVSGNENLPRNEKAINTEFDDFSYYSTGGISYFSSNRLDQENDDVFQINDLDNFANEIMISGVVKDSIQGIESAKIEVFNDGISFSKEVLTNNDGSFDIAFEEPLSESLKIKIYKEGYDILELPINKKTQAIIKLNKSNQNIQASSVLSSDAEGRGTVVQVEESINNRVSNGKTLKSNVIPNNLKRDSALKKSYLFSVIIGSFSTEKSAQDFMKSNQGELIIEGNKFRVSVFQSNDYNSTNAKLRSIKSKYRDAWIFKKINMTVAQTKKTTNPTSKGKTIKSDIIPNHLKKDSTLEKSYLFSVIIGSFSTEKSAQDFIKNNEGELTIESNKFGVSIFQSDDYNIVIEKMRNIKSKYKDAWIFKRI